MLDFFALTFPKFTKTFTDLTNSGLKRESYLKQGIGLRVAQSVYTSREYEYEHYKFPGRQEMECKYYNEMRTYCKAAVDMTADYLEGVESHRPFPSIKPGYLIEQLPVTPPQEGVTMETIYDDVDKLLLPGVSF